MPRILEFFPEIVIQVNREILYNHPVLFNDLATRPTAPQEEKLALICTYCGILVDDYYSENRLEGLFELVYNKLREKSTQIVQPVQ